MIKPEYLNEERANKKRQAEKRRNLGLLETMIDKKILSNEFSLLAGEKVGISFHRTDDPFDHLSELIKKYEENGTG